MTARDLFERAGCNAAAVAFRGEEVCVYARGLETYIPAPEWERYKALCAQWHTAGVCRPMPQRADEAAVLESVRRELGRLQTDLAAAGTCLSLDDMADALVSFMRRVKTCEEQVAQMLACGESDGSDKSDESDGVKQEGGAR